MTKSTIHPQALVRSVVSAVTEAGAMIREEFHRPGGPRGSRHSAPIDLEVEALLRRRLLADHGCGWLGEETGRVAAAHEDVWVVDPHDGTSDFMQGRRGSAISVALVRRGRPVLGVVFAPLAPDDNGDLIVWAEGGPLLRNGSETGTRPAQGPATVALNADAADYARHNHVALSGVRVRALPSPAYRLALAAAGEVDAAMSLVGGLAPWDLAGGHALLIGAGKPLYDLRGQPIDHRRASFDGCVGGDEALVARLLKTPLRAGVAAPRNPVRSRLPVADAEVLQRAQGCLLGQLAGDALGSAVEFQHEGRIRASYPDGVRFLTDGGTWNLIAGQPTDDSEMALALARSLVAGNGYSASAAGRAYVAWGDSSPFDIGGTTLAGISALAGRGRPNIESQSNGALMRSSPIGVWAAGDPARAAEAARLDARLTHPNPVCVSANAAFVAAIAIGVAGGAEQRMIEGALEHAGTDSAAETVRRTIEAALHSRPVDVQSQMGWVLIALQNAFHWLASGAPLEEAVVATVGKGGDTDTNAAICGALLGARQGRAAIPLQWRNAILTCRPVRGPGVHRPRPTTYWPDDALELAEALLTAGDE